MKVLKRMLLGAVTAASGVLIACAYGMTYSWRGRVLDRTTSEPIPGIQVTCEHDGYSPTITTTDANGEWSLPDDMGCSRLNFTDVDGAANGAYDATSLESPSPSINFVTELNPTALP